MNTLKQGCDLAVGGIATAAQTFRRLVLRCRFRGPAAVRWFSLL